MELLAIAKNIRKMLEYSSPSEKRDIYRSTLLGFFKGVESRSITIGQGWVLPILIKHVKFELETEFNLLEDIVASGMVSEGQSLFIKASKALVGREGR